MNHISKDLSQKFFHEFEQELLVSQSLQHTLTFADFFQQFFQHLERVFRGEELRGKSLHQRVIRGSPRCGFRLGFEFFVDRLLGLGALDGALRAVAEPNRLFNVGEELVEGGKGFTVSDRLYVFGEELNIDKQVVVFFNIFFGNPSQSLDIRKHELLNTLHRQPVDLFTDKFRSLPHFFLFIQSRLPALLELPLQHPVRILQHPHQLKRIKTLLRTHRAHPHPLSLPFHHLPQLPVLLHQLTIPLLQDLDLVRIIRGCRILHKLPTQPSTDRDSGDFGFDGFSATVSLVSAAVLDEFVEDAEFGGGFVGIKIGDGSGVGGVVEGFAGLVGGGFVFKDGALLVDDGAQVLFGGLGEGSHSNSNCNIIRCLIEECDNIRDNYLLLTQSCYQCYQIILIL